MKIDLHTHSIASDGKLTPTQLVKKAKRLGIIYLAKTDHDSIDLMEEFLKAGKKYNIHTITGIEISAHYKQISSHILGLNIDYKNQELKDYMRKYKLIRQARAQKIKAKLNKLGWQIDQQQLRRSLIARPHLALAVIKHPANKARLFKEFGHLPTFGEFIQRYIIPGQPAYAPKSSRIQASAAISLIHRAKGLAILAHPYSKSEEFNYSQDYLKQLVQLNFDGLEIYYPEHTPSEIKKLIQLAKHHNLLISGGSDYHDTKNKLGYYGRRALKVKLCQDLIDKITTMPKVF